MSARERELAVLWDRLEELGVTPQELWDRMVRPRCDRLVLLGRDEPREGRAEDGELRVVVGAAVVPARHWKVMVLARIEELERA